MRKIKIMRFVVFAAAILSLSCSKSDTSLTNAGNSSSPSLMENTAEFPNESSISFVDESQETFIEEQPIYEYQFTYTDEKGGIQRCVWEFSGYYQHWYESATQHSQEEISNCKKLELKDSNGKTIFKAHLKGECDLDIKLTLDYREVDTTINVCE